MEIHKKLENGTSETHYICDGCGMEIDRKHMRNSAENRESRQLNIYDNFGNVSHYCRSCSAKIENFLYHLRGRVRTM